MTDTIKKILYLIMITVLITIVVMVAVVVIAAAVLLLAPAAAVLLLAPAVVVHLIAVATVVVPVVAKRITKAKIINVECNKDQELNVLSLHEFTIPTELKEQVGIKINHD